MAMRLSTETFFQRSTNAMLEQQTRLSKTQMQVTSGRRILTPADDPIGSQQVMELSQTLQRTEQFNRNADQAIPRLELEEDVLASVGDQLQRVRELAVQGANDSQGKNDRKFIASEVRQVYDALINLANTQDGNGEYLFAGHKTTTQPFVRQGDGTIAYQGDQGQREILVGENRRVAVSDSGDAVFRQVRGGNGTFQIEAGRGNPSDPDGSPNNGSGVFDVGSVVNGSQYDGGTYRIVMRDDTGGSTGAGADDAARFEVQSWDGANWNDLAPPVEGAYQEGAAISFKGIQTEISGTPKVDDAFVIEPSDNQDIFSTVRDLYRTLEGAQSNDAEKATFRNEINNVLASLNGGLDKVLDVRAQIGGRLNNIEDQRETNEVLALTTKETKSKLEDLDFAEAITRLNQEMSGLQASQKVYTRLQNLSVFNYM